MAVEYFVAGAKILPIILNASGLSDEIKDKFRGDPIDKAFSKALNSACAEVARRHPRFDSDYFDVQFFENEAAPILAKFLSLDESPDPTELAVTWTSWSNKQGRESGSIHIKDLEPVAADFLGLLSKNLGKETVLHQVLEQRTLQQVADSAGAIRRALGADQATLGTRIDYLNWIIDQNRYLHPGGISLTHRQVKVRLDEIFVPLGARRDDTPTLADRRLPDLDIQAEVSNPEQEQGPEESHADGDIARSPLDQLGRRHDEDLELLRIVKLSPQVVILGDPGGGKSTLLRYLALQHAERLLNDAGADSELGLSRLPILLRIAEYADDQRFQTMPISAFLPEYAKLRECPSSGLADLLRSQLEKGQCLILLDGLDEVVSADDRRAIVRRIEDFIRQYSKYGNHFVVTSRIAGYRAASFAENYPHYVIQELDEKRVERFLQRWCLAVEIAETPAISPEAQQREAQTQIESIMASVRQSPGVRRLAANPLLLRILALIHRTEARLPHKRIDLYKTAADTLSQTWRQAQGVPESALIDDRYLTRILGTVAYWIHLHRPTGLVTEAEAIDIIGREWARINRVEWDPEEPDLAIVGDVDKFLTQVREQTGLFVERSPGNYGFMHLTFEEYYAARYLIAKSRTRVKLIHDHLHDPRWMEPILLALGFVGLDYPEDASELIESAILAQSEEADEMEIYPSNYENLLGRDYLFALRCAGDQIPMEDHLAKNLGERLVRAIVLRDSLGKIESFRTELDELVEELSATPFIRTVQNIAHPFLESSDIDVRTQAATLLCDTGIYDRQVIQALLEAHSRPEHNRRASYENTMQLARAIRNSREDVNTDEIVEFLRTTNLSEFGVERLAHAIIARSSNGEIGRLTLKFFDIACETEHGSTVAGILGALMHYRHEILDFHEKIETQLTKHANSGLRHALLVSLCRSLPLDDPIVESLVNLIDKDVDESEKRAIIWGLQTRDAMDRDRVAEILLSFSREPFVMAEMVFMSRVIPDAIDWRDEFARVLETTDDPYILRRILEDVDFFSDDDSRIVNAAERILTTIDDRDVRVLAATAIVVLGNLSPSTQERMREIYDGTNELEVKTAISLTLTEQGIEDPEYVEALSSVFTSTEASEFSARIARALTRSEIVNDSFWKTLAERLSGDSNLEERRRLATVIADNLSTKFCANRVQFEEIMKDEQDMFVLCGLLSALAMNSDEVEPLLGEFERLFSSRLEEGLSEAVWENVGPLGPGALSHWIVRVHYAEPTHWMKSACLKICRKYLGAPTKGLMIESIAKPLKMIIDGTVESSLNDGSIAYECLMSLVSKRDFIQQN